MANSAVFALCVRSTGRYLARVLANLEALAGLYERSAFVFVENDSVDDSRERLRAWAAAHADTTVIEMDGVDKQRHKRTDRLAFCRNAYIDFIKASPYAAYDQLVMLDADEVNSPPIDLSGFARGRDWLADNEAAAVFANSLPFYYDVYALRHPHWCPTNYSTEVRQHSEELGAIEAKQRFCFDRQIPIPVTAEPIPVVSAFGGLAIYRMADALRASYVGLTEKGLQVCEHVSFNRDVARGGRGLYILPWMTAGIRRAGIYSDDMQSFSLPGMDDGSEWLAPAGYDITSGHRPAAGTLPLLARRLGEAAPGSWALDAGAGVGEAVILCRRAGANLHFAAIEPSLRNLKCLMLNRAKSPERLAGLRTHWGALDGGPPPDPATPAYALPPRTSLQALAAENAIAPDALSLVRFDCIRLGLGVLAPEREFLKARAPVVWIRAHIRSSEDAVLLEASCLDLAADWPHALVFGPDGATLAEGETARQALGVVGRLAASASHLDLAFFPSRLAGLFRNFLAERSAPIES